MNMPGFEARKLGKQIRPRTIGDLLDKDYKTIGKLPATILDEYNKYIDDNFEGLKVLKPYSKGKDNKLAGSNILANSAMNGFIKKYNMRLARLDEIGKDINAGNFDFYKGFYYDIAIMINGDKINNYYATQIAEQLDRDMKLPAMINLADTNIELDKKAPYGVSFIVDPKKAFTADVLIPENDNKRFSKYDENGIPILDENGEYTLYVGDNGLFESSLYWYGDFDCYSDDLDNSDSDDRVVAIKE